jgi:hypothetical protein
VPCRRGRIDLLVILLKYSQLIDRLRRENESAKFLKKPANHAIMAHAVFISKDINWLHIYAELAQVIMTQ